LVVAFTTLWMPFTVFSGRFVFKAKVISLVAVILKVGHAVLFSAKVVSGRLR